jgi:ATP-dependent helicase/nuclease subunit A
MMNPQWLASDPNTSVWVAASAGTGKTKILTDRVLRLLLAGNEPGRILCLTFTKAAAYEMANRIHRDLASWVQIDQILLEERLAELTGLNPSIDLINKARKLFAYVLDAPDGLKIQTIHSFCQSLIQQFPIEAGISNNFRIIDENDAYLLLSEAKLNLLANLREETICSAINYLSWHLFENSLNELIKEIISHQSKFASLFEAYPLIDDLITATYQRLGVNIEDSKESLQQSFCLKTDFDTLKAMAQLMLCGGSQADSKKGEQLLQWLNFTTQEKIESFGLYQDIFITKTGTLTSKLITKKLSDQFSNLEEILAKEQQRIAAHLEQMKSLKVAELTKCLLYLSHALLGEYRKLKAQKSLLDYSDLINISDDLLGSSEFGQWILYKLDGGIDHILIDEAQDTSKEQWRIIENLSSEFFASSKDNKKTLFVVGDEKQSIFSFQGADPVTFHYMHNFFQQKSSPEENSFNSITLDTSFRSVKVVLELVDLIFNDEKIKKSVSFSPEYIKHNAYRKASTGSIEVWPLLSAFAQAEETAPWQLPLEYIQVQNPAAKLAKLISLTIKEWLDDRRILHSKNRPIGAGDILILVRRRNEFTDFLLKELKKLSLPVAGIDRMLINEHIAVNDLVAIGHFLLLPKDDYSLACVLKSPLIGFTEEQLLALACERNSLSLWEQLLLRSSHNEECQKAANYLQDLLEQYKLLTPFYLYSYILEQDGRKKMWQRLGSEVNDPLDEFLNLALKYENNHIPCLQRFLDWFESVEFEIKRDLEQNADKIRIMTVHSAKGLQAPIVILPDTTFTLNNQDIFLFDDDLIFWPGKVANLNHQCQTLKKVKLNSENNEHLRLLYVALTRAEDELIICGYYGKNTPATNCWYNIVREKIALLGVKKNFYIHEGLEEYFKEQEYYSYSDKQENVEPAITLPSANLATKPILPEWIQQPLPKEDQYLYIAPSRGTDQISCSPLENRNSLIRGKIIHRLLQLLPGIKERKRRKAANNFLSKYSHELSKKDQAKIINACLTLFEHKELKLLFSKDAVTEVPISGVINDKYIINGVIDRLYVGDKHVVIVDYKTNRSVPLNQQLIPVSYLKQMAAYRYLLTEIYPKKKIFCGLIWTEIPLYMEVPNVPFLDYINI